MALQQYHQLEQERNSFIQTELSSKKIKKNKNVRTLQATAELLNRFSLGQDGKYQLVHPTDSCLRNSGRGCYREKTFLGLLTVEKLSPTGDIKLATTEELVDFLKFDYLIEFSGKLAWEEDYYPYRALKTFTALKSNEKNMKVASFVNSYLEVLELPYSGTQPESSYQSSEKGKETEVTVTQWILNPSEWDVNKVKQARSQITKEEREQVLEYLEDMDSVNQKTLKVDYTALRFLTDLFDPYEVNDMTNQIYYKLARNLDQAYAHRDRAFKKIGKKLSRHYCYRVNLRKNRGMHERFGDLNLGAQRNNRIRTFLLKHFNYLVYVITGKIRTVNLPNSCGFDALRNAYEYNNQTFPKARLILLLNEMPDLRNRITYFGMQANTMSAILDGLHTPVHVVDHDLNMIMESNEEVTFPGHIKNLNQHYTYTLEEIDADKYNKVKHNQSYKISPSFNGGFFSTTLKGFLTYVTLSLKIDFSLLSAFASAYTLGAGIHWLCMHYAVAATTAGCIVGISFCCVFLITFSFVFGMMLN